MLRTLKILLLSSISILLINFGLVKLDKTNATNSEEVKADKELGWDFSSYQTRQYNDIGLRNAETSRQLINDKRKKIVFLGNSVVAGTSFSYDKTFTFKTQELWGNRYLFLNGGQGGYEIYREFLKYKRDFSAINASLVVWFPNRNDFQSRESIFRAFIQTAEAQGTSDVNEKFKLKDIIKGFNSLSAKIQEEKESLTVNFLWSEKNNYYTNLILSPLDVELKTAFDKEIGSFNNYLKSKNTKFLVVFVPSHFYCRYHKWSEAKAFLDTQEILKKHGISSIELFDVLPCKEEPLFLDYVHLNEQGHMKIAELISQKMKGIFESL